MIQFDTQEAFLIPDNKREQYFDWVDTLHTVLKSSNTNEAWNTYNDNIIIADKEYFSKHNWQVILKFMEDIGAKNITESLQESK